MTVTHPVPRVGTVRRIGKWRALLGVVVIGAATWWYLQPKWTPLPDSGEFRILKMQFGEGVVSADRVPLRYKLLDPLSPVFDLASDILGTGSLRRVWSNAVGPRAISKAYNISEPQLVIWLLVRGREAVPNFPYSRCWITLPDGQEFWTGLHDGDGNGRETLYSIDLYYFPRDQQRLKLRLESWDGTASSPMEIENPAYLDERPNWVPETLPHTKRVGNFEVTLTGITSRFVPMPAPNSTTWIADPHFDVRPLNGERNEWYDFWPGRAGSHGDDSPAMFYQPCWKVTLSITPRENHPQYGVAKRFVAEFFAKPPPPPPIK